MPFLERDDPRDSIKFRSNRGEVRIMPDKICVRNFLNVASLQLKDTQPQHHIRTIDYQKTEFH
jgi:hypothetical protein